MFNIIENHPTRGRFVILRDLSETVANMVAAELGADATEGETFAVVPAS